MAKTLIPLDVGVDVTIAVYGGKFYFDIAFLHGLAALAEDVEGTVFAAYKEGDVGHGEFSKCQRRCRACNGQMIAVVAG